MPEKDKTEYDGEFDFSNAYSGSNSNYTGIYKGCVPIPVDYDAVEWNGGGIRCSTHPLVRLN